MRKFTAALLASLCALLLALPALAVSVVNPTGYANDYAGVLSAEAEEYIELGARKVEDATGAKVFFVTVETTKPAALDEYAIELADRLKIGRGGGKRVLTLLSIGDDDFFIADSTGLANDLPDAEYDALWGNIRTDMAAKDYSSACVKCFDALSERILSLYGPKPTVAASPSPTGANKTFAANQPGQTANAQNGVVQPTGSYASDFAGVLSAEAKQHIERNAKALEDATGAQIVFVTVDTTKPSAIDDYAFKLFNTWKIGDAVKNNGILVLLAIGDDDYYTLEGTGLERNLPTEDLSAMWNEYLEPDFAAKDYSSGSVKYFNALFERVSDIYGAGLTIAGGPSVQPTPTIHPAIQAILRMGERESDGFRISGDAILVILFLILVIIIGFSQTKNGRSGGGDGGSTRSWDDDDDSGGWSGGSSDGGGSFTSGSSSSGGGFSGGGGSSRGAGGGRGR